MSSNSQIIADKNKKLFSRLAGYYDNFLFRIFYFGNIYKRAIREIESEVQEFSASLKILDAACGTGEIIFRLAKKFPNFEFTGVDFSDKMIERSVKKNNGLKNASFKVAPVTKLPFVDNYFDIAFCTEAFHHIAFPNETIMEIHRVLKPGGKFLLVDPAFNSRAAKLIGNILFKRLENAYYYYSRQELENLLRQHGFETQKSYTYFFNNYLWGVKQKQ